MNKTVKYVGMDVHKKTIDIAIAEDGRDAEVRHYGTINNDADSINGKKAVKKGSDLLF